MSRTADEAFRAACAMADDLRQPKPSPDAFAHLTDIEPVAPAQPATAPADAAPGWDAAAFEALPAELRSAVQAGTAAMVGRAALQAAAERELARPDDVHHHITDPAKYVNQAGQVDREAIAADLRRLTGARPEMSRWGHGSHQHGLPPDPRARTLPADSALGARPGPSGSDAGVDAALAGMIGDDRRLGRRS